MPVLRFTAALNRFFPGLTSANLPGSTVSDVLSEAEKHFPGLCDYLLQDDGSLRRHVNIFVNGERVTDRVRLSDPIGDTDEVYILQALSGG